MNATSLTGDELVAAHKSAVRKLRIVGILFPVLFIGLIVWNLYSIADQFRNIDSAAVGTHLSDRVNTLLPEINNSLSEVADAVEPALFTALENESLAMAPKIEARLQTEVDKTIKGARDSLGTAAHRTMESKSDEARALIIAQFPELASDPAAQDLVLAAAEEALTQWELHQLNATIAEHVIAIDQLRSTLQASYSHPADRPADPEDALMTWLNLVNQHIGGEDEILTGDTKPKARGAAAAAATK